MKKILFLFFLVASLQGRSQLLVNPNISRINTINTAVPFLRITPDAHSGGMGDAGIASCDDVHSIFWNTSKLSFAKKKTAFVLTYTPWLKELVNDIFLADASFYKKIDSLNAVTASFRYFSLGTITFTDISGKVIGNFSPREFTAHIGCSRKLARDFSAGINFGYVYSNLASGQSVNNVPIRAGTAAVGDLSFCYSHLFDSNFLFRKLNIGLSVSNMGNKITYTQSAENRDFLPMNLGIGSAAFFHLDEKNIFTLAFDVNKLLVPTPDSAGTFRSKSVVQGALHSFNDAEGGLAEELTEINYSAGAEYSFDDRIFFRAGYFYEYPNKGNRHYATVGGGYRYHILQLDASVLLPTYNQKNPLDNTFRFSLSFQFPSSGKNKYPH